MNQLSQAVDYKHNRKYVYTYDSAGNILSEVVTNNDTGAEISSKTFTYDTESGWGDLLKLYNDQEFEYDAIGNPTKYRDDMSMLWSNGRQLTNLTKDDKTTITYTYDDSGMRLTKTVDGVKYTYLYEGGLLVQETRGDMIFDYSYDANGRIRMGAYRSTPSSTPSYFYYALNTRGDVVGLYNSSGSLYAKYTYDAWGNETSITDADGNSVAHRDILATRQPFRYRGYYYDRESKLYYLQSRYYDPLTHRFINADTQLNQKDGVIGLNMFAYCNNNPVNQSDPDGHLPKWLEKAAKVVAVAAVVVTAVAVVTAVTVGSGGLALTAVGVAFGMACGGLVGGIANEAKGESFVNGWIGGATSGFTQSVGTATFGSAGTIAGGGLGSGLGTAVTESLNNIGKPISEQKPFRTILNDSLKSGAIATIASTATAGIGYGVDYAQGPMGYNSWADSLKPGVGIAPITPRFGEMLKGFFGSVDDSMVYIFCD